MEETGKNEIILRNELNAFKKTKILTIKTKSTQTYEFISKVKNQSNTVVSSMFVKFQFCGFRYKVDPQK